MMNNADLEIRTKGSLCSGTAALDAAVPGQLRWVAETNQAAAAVLKREYPGVPNFGDVITTDWNYRQHHVDLMTSGDPCQSMSAAGRQKASEDERFLWPYVIEMIRATNPRHLFLENVQNLVSVALVKGATDWRGERGSVLKMRLNDLRAAGYAVRWTVLGACAVGAPHHRHRWFLRGTYLGADAPEAVRVLTGCGAPRNGLRVLLPTPVSGDADGRGEGSPDFWARRGEYRANGMPLGAAVNLLPTPRATDGEYRANGMPLGAAVNLLPTPRATDGVNGGPNQRGRKGDLAMGSAVQTEHWGKFAQAVALWERIIGRPAPDPTVLAPKGGRRLNPALSEWMMGYPEGYLTRNAERNEALRMAGNGVVTLQARAAWDMLS
jgi:DNA (cytosine-5)-methyltransferase 1